MPTQSHGGRFLFTIAHSRVASMTARPNFHLYVAVACAMTAFAAFSPTYFLRGLSDLPPLSTRAHIHGAVFSAWMLLFVAQATLVRADRCDLHRQLGIAGAALAVLMVWAGAAAALGVAVRFEASGFRPHGLTPVAFLAVQLGMLLQFATFIALAIGFRRRADVHKRLMVLATISILPPAIARLHLENYGLTVPHAATLIAYLFVLVAAGHDYARVRRVHPAYLWGGLAMLAWMFLRSELGKTEAWHAIGRWLIG
jgi:hypothetical protein